MSGRLVSAGYRIIGTPPGAGAPRKERLLWLRRYYLRMVPLALAGYVLVAVFLPAPWAWAVPAGGALLWMQGFASLSRRIRREDRRGDESQDERRSSRPAADSDSRGHPAATLGGVDLEDWQRWWKTRGAAELRVLLIARWDPIKINGVPEAADEYDAYLGPLARKLREGADAHAVCEYLSDVQTERMGLPAKPEQLIDVGEQVTRWYSVAMLRLTDL
jgi:hypothetical protein